MIMEAETRKALHESIEHWERIVQGRLNDGEDLGRQDCALCRLFNTDHNARQYTQCIGCPVYEHTGEKFCRGTPYEDVESIYDEMNADLKRCIDLDEFEEAARKELEFLRSLLPPPTTETT